MGYEKLNERCGMKTITIDRSKWNRGGGKYSKILGVTSLLSPKGGMCCLGFICNQAGVPKEHMLNKEMPGRVHHKRVPRCLVSNKMNSDLAIDASTINDYEDMAENTREAKIKKLFADHFNIVFVGKTPRKNS